MSKSKKILVLGVDGMDPSLSKKYLDQGIMPNLQKFIKAGSSSKDLKLLGGVPTITPPMWTSLATGANPSTHGITCFWGQSKENMAAFEYNMTSKRCKAEQLWNVTANAGLKTLVWHWPGSSWPPSSSSPNLHVVDGTQPTSVGNGDCVIDNDKVLWARSDIEAVRYEPKVANTSGAGCTLSDIPEEEQKPKLKMNLIMSEEEGDPSADRQPYEKIYSPLKDAYNWAYDVPAGALEFRYVLYDGKVSRPGLIVKDEYGKYNKVVLFKSKKDSDPWVVLEKDKFYMDIREQLNLEAKSYNVNRHIRLLELDESTGDLKLYFGQGMDIDKDDLWHPKKLKQSIIKNVGPVPGVSMSDASDEELAQKVLLPTISYYVDWQAKAMNHLIAEEDYDVVFSHIHNVDTCGHLFWYFAKHRKEVNNNESVYQKAMEQTYIDTDRYLGSFLHLLEKGWTIMLLSDHGLLTPPEDEIPLLGDGFGCNVRIMQDLGYTVLKTDANGNELREIDYTKTRAVANRGNQIYINLKGRESQGIVDIKDKYELEREIIDDLYNYRQNGRRIVSIALRNKDAAVLGLSGDECGDILYWLEEGANRLHGDSLPTFEGLFMTSVSPIFVAAGPGIKTDFTTSRVIRTIDVAPTIATLLDIPMPADCEGAPVYQIID